MTRLPLISTSGSMALFFLLTASISFDANAPSALKTIAFKFSYSTCGSLLLLVAYIYFADTQKKA
ncbi:hypothetical protein OG21DRAFT_1515509 [Imleria badia]|nr:hypothetical protein OG21DRAFT_1515509 [Imleria badia]